MNPSREILLIDFNRKKAGKWDIVNDGVMGGISTSRIEFTPDNLMVFSGTVSLENNGGFASFRMKLDERISGCTQLIMHLKGDGKKYKFRIRTDDQWNGVAFSHDFRTIEAAWMKIEIPLKDFRPTCRGREFLHSGELKAEKIRELGLLISDQQAGPFSIILDWIKCY
ncbi:MAG: CIA30 family protein [Cyclobacteriaceae bacterium]|nr:CIA30 family protein [Cyclobacteriaceae bacterium]